MTFSYDELEYCFFSAAQRTIWDMAYMIGDMWVSAIRAIPLPQWQLECPDMKVVRIDEAADLLANSFKSEPAPITEEQYRYNLEVLPPQGWVGGGGGSSFKCLEHLYGPITLITVKRGEEYFSFHDLSTLTHAQIMAKLPPAKE